MTLEFWDPQASCHVNTISNFEPYELPELELLAASQASPPSSEELTFQRLVFAFPPASFPSFFPQLEETYVRDLRFRRLVRANGVVDLVV